MRGLPNLAAQMTRPKGFKKPSMDSNIPPPNFDEISKRHPLPDMASKNDSKRRNSTQTSDIISQILADNPRQLNIQSLTATMPTTVCENMNNRNAHHRTESNSLDGILKAANVSKPPSTNSLINDQQRNSNFIQSHLSNQMSLPNTLENVTDQGNPLSINAIESILMASEASSGNHINLNNQLLAAQNMIQNSRPLFSSFHQNLPQQIAVSNPVQYLDFLWAKNYPSSFNTQRQIFLPQFGQLHNLNSLPNLPQVNMNVYLNQVLNSSNQSLSINNGGHDIQQLLEAIRGGNNVADASKLS